MMDVKSSEVDTDFIDEFSNLKVNSRMGKDYRSRRMLKKVRKLIEEKSEYTVVLKDELAELEQDAEDDDEGGRSMTPKEIAQHEDWFGGGRTTPRESDDAPF